MLMRHVGPQLSEYVGIGQSPLTFDFIVDISKQLGQDSSLGGSVSENEATHSITLSVLHAFL